MGDITEKYLLPNIIDIKLGFKTWSPDTSIQKRLRKENKASGTRNTLGFNVKGLQVHSLGDNESYKTKVKFYNKTIWESLTPHSVSKLPEIFFDINDSNYAQEYAAVVVEKLNEIYNAFSEQRKYCFTGSSILIAYDAHAVSEFRRRMIDYEELKEFVDAKVIDFGNTYLSKGEPDDNFLSGLSNLINVFENFCTRPKVLNVKIEHY